MSEYVHAGSGDTRGGGSAHKTNSDADQRKQVGVESQFLSVFFIHSFVLYNSHHAVQGVHIM